ncbi:MAG: ABC transporter substrate-binding protein [Chloroflexota bacterium]
MKLRIVLAFLLIALSLMVTQCTSPAATPSAPTAAPTQAAAKAPEPAKGGTIRVGGLYPLTGDLAKLGEENKNGLQLAIDELNAAGGIKELGGAKIEMVWGDSQGKPEVGISEVERLVQQEKVVAIIGAYQSGVTTPATQAAERLSTPFLVSMAVADKITERGFKYTFRVCPKASWYAKDQVSFLKDLKEMAGLTVKRVALLHEDTDFGESTAAGQKKYLAEAGMEMVLEVKYPSNAADLSTEVSKVKAANPDAVLTVTYLNDAILIAQARESMGLAKIPFVDAAGGTVDPEFIKRLGPTAEGWLTEVEYTKYAAGAAPLNDRYKARFGVDITGNGAYAYQSGWLIADALGRAGKADRDAVREALAKTDFKKGPNLVLPTDRIYFDEQGQNPNCPLYIVQVQNGDMKPVWPKAYAASELKLGK